MSSWCKLNLKLDKSFKKGIVWSTTTCDFYYFMNFIINYVYVLCHLIHILGARCYPFRPLRAFVIRISLICYQCIDNI